MQKQSFKNWSSATLIKRVIPLLLFTTGLLVYSGCLSSDTNSELKHAEPYLIVGEGKVANEEKDRTVGLWFIISDDATGFEEYAQTAIKAVRDLYNRYGRDFTSVMLVASNTIKIPYATANYAADGKGALGMTGSAHAIEDYWKVRATNRKLTEQELAIAELWSEKLTDFPSKNPLSSLSYDEKALRQYVADALDIPYDDVKYPKLNMVEYDYDERL